MAARLISVNTLLACPLGKVKFPAEVVVTSSHRAVSDGKALSLTDLSVGEFRQASDGWQILLRMRS